MTTLNEFPQRLSYGLDFTEGPAQTPPPAPHLTLTVVQVAALANCSKRRVVQALNARILTDHAPNDGVKRHARIPLAEAQQFALLVAEEARIAEDMLARRAEQRAEREAKRLEARVKKEGEHIAASDSERLARVEEMVQRILMAVSGEVRS
jgi:hypothetical protein